ncbi:MAG: hypothetical protein RIR26_2786 [Pseudomonadota bacterium]
MDNVINLFSRRSATKTATAATAATSATAARASDSAQPTSSAVACDASSFNEVAERNRANQLRLRKEREQANKNVLKSYRIK